MSHKLFIFPFPSDSRCELKHDATGIVIIGVIDTHPSGRVGVSFLFPEETPNGNGARLFISSPGKVSLDMRGIIWFQNERATFEVDDFHLQDKVPEVKPIPFPIKPVEIPSTPLDVIKDTFARGKFDLNTKEGCGEFTEACVEALHGILSNKYGHIKKTPPQNMYNGHAVDALMLLEKQGETEPGIYDIILDTESLNAKPQFIFKGPPVPDIWYYPA